MGGRVLGIVAAAALMASSAWAADPVQPKLDAARAAYQKGDLPRAAQELESALAALHARLGTIFADTMPPAPAGWTADAAEVQGLGTVGGGLSVTRAYAASAGDATLNASLIIDSPAVAAAAALLANPAATAAQPNMKRVKVGNDEALMRWDAGIRSGEITMVLGNRILLEIQGDNLKSADVLTEAAKGWNIAGIRKTAGL